MKKLNELDNWRPIKFNDSYLFLNKKDDTICFHPPFLMNNLDYFLV